MTEQKVAIVTGGARGIGRAIAVELARAGYYLVINYRANDQAAQETLEMIRAAGSVTNPERSHLVSPLLLRDESQHQPVEARCELGGDEMTGVG